uniref:Subtilisin-like protease n=1 Tax=Cajanus cajan TaxID=3821 RepID=A0A151SHV0_CAJCA|nr:Subtilisin-like protease [Cajanus cajan]
MFSPPPPLPSPSPSPILSSKKPSQPPCKPSLPPFKQPLTTLTAAVAAAILAASPAPSPAQEPPSYQVYYGTAASAANYLGFDIVIRVIDTVMSSKSQSFHDHDLGLSPCIAGEYFPPTSGNRKLIGACYFYADYEATNNKMNSTLEYCSPRDSDGHDTHTASITVRRYVFPTSIMGYAKGMAAWMAPKARLTVYKVYWNAGCLTLTSWPHSTPLWPTLWT